ncbi:MAG: hypothetical protein Q8R33_00365 [Burkholderiales bacterium]|nr:hypothetical protein [Burkholderiales bacterium]
MQTDHADNQLAELLDALVRGREPSAFARDWLLRGILAALRRGDSLDQCLGLSGSGVESLQRRVFRMQRNQHLVDAIAAVAIGDVSAWERCTRLARLVREFKATAWPKARTLVEPGDDWPAWKRSVFRAMQTDLSIPVTAKGLHEALTESGACCGEWQKRRLLARYL